MSALICTELAKTPKAGLQEMKEEGGTREWPCRHSVAQRTAVLARPTDAVSSQRLYSVLFHYESVVPRHGDACPATVGLSRRRLPFVTSLRRLSLLRYETSALRERAVLLEINSTRSRSGAAGASFVFVCVFFFSFRFCVFLNVST